MRSKRMKKKNFVIAIDFDDTLFTKSWPKKGDPRRDVIGKLKEFVKEGAHVALWTCREADSLREAVARAKTEGIEFDAVNENVGFVRKWVDANERANGGRFSDRKIWANIYVDDRAHGSIEAFLGMDAKKMVAEAK